MHAHCAFAVCCGHTVYPCDRDEMAVGTAAVGTAVGTEMCMHVQCAFAVCCQGVAIVCGESIRDDKQRQHLFVCSPVYGMHVHACTVCCCIAGTMQT